MQIDFSWRFVGLFICIAFFISCKKQNESRTSKTSLLISAPWKLTAATFHGDWNGDGVIDPIDEDLFSSTDQCSKDNLLIFNEDGSGVYDEGIEKCNGTPQTTLFSWSFINPYTGVYDERVIKFKSFGFKALSIVELSNTILKVQNIVSNGLQNYTYEH